MDDVLSWYFTGGNDSGRAMMKKRMKRDKVLLQLFTILNMQELFNIGPTTTPRSKRAAIHFGLTSPDLIIFLAPDSISFSARVFLRLIPAPELGLLLVYVVVPIAEVSGWKLIVCNDGRRGKLTLTRGDRAPGAPLSGNLKPSCNLKAAAKHKHPPFVRHSSSFCARYATDTHYHSMTESQPVHCTYYRNTPFPSTAYTLPTFYHR